MYFRGSSHSSLTVPLSSVIKQSSAAVMQFACVREIMMFYPPLTALTDVGLWLNTEKSANRSCCSCVKNQHLTSSFPVLENLHMWFIKAQLNPGASLMLESTQHDFYFWHDLLFILNSSLLPPSTVNLELNSIKMNIYRHFSWRVECWIFWLFGQKETFDCLAEGRNFEN